MFCIGLCQAKLADANLADKRIVHYCSHDPKKVHGSDIEAPKKYRSYLKNPPKARCSGIRGGFGFEALGVFGWGVVFWILGRGGTSGPSAVAKVSKMGSGRELF